ncbi:hypothetical protein FRB97_006742 [Tulasnella sp. 331]|nr:hypothetical protein FRB97_006742 [Tulasnella sp. 331]
MTAQSSRLFRCFSILSALSWTIRAAPVTPSTTFRLPTPLNATFPVGSQVFKLVDDSRVDPFNSTEKRAVEITVSYPSISQDNGACPNGTSFAPYMPVLMAGLEDKELGIPDGTFESIFTDTCLGAPPVSLAQRKLIIFSPGLGISRLIYQTYTTALAAHGYVVVSVDHPYDADIVEYPDGRLVFAAPINDSSTTDIARRVGIRIEDLQFVLNQVCGNGNLTQGIAVDCGVRKVGMFGHSLGGATTADMTIVDQRIAGGINLDGTFFPTQPGPDVSPDTPFLVFASEGHNGTVDPTYGNWYKVAGGNAAPRVMITVKGAAHLSFSDFPVLVKLLNFPETALTADERAALGTIDGDRISEILQVYLKAAFDLVLLGDSSNSTTALFTSGEQTFSELDVVDEKP